MYNIEIDINGSNEECKASPIVEAARDLLQAGN